MTLHVRASSAPDLESSAPRRRERRDTLETPVPGTDGSSLNTGAATETHTCMMLTECSGYRVSLCREVHRAGLNEDGSPALSLGSPPVVFSPEIPYSHSPGHGGAALHRSRPGHTREGRHSA